MTSKLISLVLISLFELQLKVATFDFVLARIRPRRQSGLKSANSACEQCQIMRKRQLNLDPLEDAKEMQPDNWPTRNVAEAGV